MGEGARRGAGSTASRLVVGTDLETLALEQELAAWKGTEAALLFGSGYAANLGVLTALLGRGDAVFSDSLDHASIIDGCRLSGATIHRYRHCDAGHLATLLESAPARAAEADRDRVGVLDGRRRRTACPARRPCRAPRCGPGRGRSARGWSLRAAGRRPRARARARGSRRSHDRHPRQGVRRVRCLCRGSTGLDRLAGEHLPSVRLHDGAAPGRRERCTGGARARRRRRANCGIPCVPGRSCSEAGSLPSVSTQPARRPRSSRYSSARTSERSRSPRRSSATGCSASPSGRRRCPKERRGSGCR